MGCKSDNLLISWVRLEYFSHKYLATWFKLKVGLVISYLASDSSIEKSLLICVIDDG